MSWVEQVYLIKWAVSVYTAYQNTSSSTQLQTVQTLPTSRRRSCAFPPAGGAAERASRAGSARWGAPLSPQCDSSAAAHISSEERGVDSSRTLRSSLPREDDFQEEEGKKERKKNTRNWQEIDRFAAGKIVGEAVFVFFFLFFFFSFLRGWIV